VSLVTDVSNGSLTLNSDGTFSYTHDGSENFTDSFTYRITDNDGETSDATVSISITPVSDATPVANVDSISLLEGGTANTLVGGASTLLNNDTGLLDTPVTVSLVSDVSYGALTLNSDGTFSYTHDGSENFSDSFIYRITDNDGQTTDATVNIAVTAVNEAPTITSYNGNSEVSLTLSENVTTVTTVTATDADNDSLSFTVDDGTDLGLFSIDPSSGELVFINAPDVENPQDSAQDNVYQVQVLVSDGNGGTDRQTFNIEVSDVDEFDVSLLMDLDDAPDEISLLTSLNEQVGITAWADDPDGSNNSISYSLDGDAEGIFLIDPSTGVITLASSVANQDVSEFEITVRATSEDGSYSLRTFSIALNRAVDLEPESEEIYLDEIIFDLVPTDTATSDQSAATQNGSKDNQASTQSSSDAATESDLWGELSDTIPQTELDESALSNSDSFLSALLGTEGRDTNHFNYIKTRLTPTPLSPDELPQFNTLSGELMEVPETLWNLLDAMNQEMSENRDEDVESDGLVLQSATFGTLTFSAGYVVWLLRAGVLSASLLSSVPLWRQVDPLPVLSARAMRRDTGQKEVADDDPQEKQLSKIFGRSNKSKRNRSLNTGKA
jgi:VCBS repeat-containing protein